jgi:hypothetical protein
MFPLRGTSHVPFGDYGTSEGRLVWDGVDGQTLSLHMRRGLVQHLDGYGRSQTWQGYAEQKGESSVPVPLILGEVNHCIGMAGPEYDTLLHLQKPFDGQDGGYARINLPRKSLWILNRVADHFDGSIELSDGYFYLIQARYTLTWT